MSPTPRALLVLAALSLAALSCNAGPITYSVEDPICCGWSVTGTITTDGTVGVLSAGNVIGWGLLIDDVPLSQGFMMGPNDSALTVVGSDFTATATALYFNFDTSASYFNFLHSGSLPNTSASFAACAGVLDVPPPVCIDITDVFAVYVGGIGGAAIAENGEVLFASTVPEPSGLVLLGLGAAVLLASRKKQNERLVSQPPVVFRD